MSARAQTSCSNRGPCSAAVTIAFISTNSGYSHAYRYMRHPDSSYTYIHTHTHTYYIDTPLYQRGDQRTPPSPLGLGLLNGITLAADSEDSRRGLGFGLHTIVCLLYGAWHTKGELGGRILPNRRAMVLQQCGQCRRDKKIKGCMIRAQTTRSKNTIL